MSSNNKYRIQFLTSLDTAYPDQETLKLHLYYDLFVFWVVINIAFL